MRDAAAIAGMKWLHSVLTAQLACAAWEAVGVCLLLLELPSHLALQHCDLARETRLQRMLRARGVAAACYNELTREVCRRDAWLHESVARCNNTSSL